MPKTVAVVDERGNQYEATYPRRAKGLVKRGRARFISEDTICLARPPESISNFTEVCTMSDTRKNMPIDPACILEKIAAIAADSAHIAKALDALTAMSDGENCDVCGAPPNLMGQAKAEAIGSVVAYREETNRQLLSFYEKVYDDLMAAQGLRSPAEDSANDE